MTSVNKKKIISYTLGKKIGSGAFGEVYSSTLQSEFKESKECAIKQIFCDKYNKQDRNKYIKNIIFEFLIGKNLGNHPNIVKMFDINIISSYRYELVSSLYETDLKKFMRGNFTSLDTIWKIIYQITCGLEYLHSANIAHLDLTPTNIFINNGDMIDVAIGDFGASQIKDKDGDIPTDYRVTRWYRPPDVPFFLYVSGKSIDIWSLGCVLVEMIINRPLFPGANTYHQLELIFQLLGSYQDTALVSKIRAENALDWYQKNVSYFEAENFYSIISDHRFNNRPTTTFVEDETNLRKIINFAKDMLHLDPKKRITPSFAFKSYLKNIGETFDEKPHLMKYKGPIIQDIDPHLSCYTLNKIIEEESEKYLEIM